MRMFNILIFFSFFSSLFAMEYESDTHHDHHLLPIYSLTRSLHERGYEHHEHLSPLNKLQHAKASTILLFAGNLERHEHSNNKFLDATIDTAAQMGTESVYATMMKIASFGRIGHIPAAALLLVSDLAGVAADQFPSWPVLEKKINNITWQNPEENKPERCALIRQTLWKTVFTGFNILAKHVNSASQWASSDVKYGLQAKSNESNYSTNVDNSELSLSFFKQDNLFKAAQLPPINFDKKMLANLTIQPTLCGSNSLNLSRATPQFDSNVKISVTVETDTAADMYQGLHDQYVIAELKKILKIRKTEYAQLNILYDNLANANKTMADNVNHIYNQICNVRNLIDQTIDFCTRDCTIYMVDDINILFNKLANLNMNLHHKFNWFINLPKQDMPFGIYMEKWALPASKKYLGGQDPADKKIFSLERATHWKGIYSIAQANTLNAMKNIQDMFKQLNGNRPIVFFRSLEKYIKALHPTAERKDIIRFYKSIMKPKRQAVN